jgi:rRNA-processing protein FCF1
MMLTLYLDTDLWNLLCKGDVNPEELLSGLSAHDCKPVISTQLICELAAAYKSQKKENPAELGKSLFRYLNKFVQRGVECVEMNSTLLQQYSYLCRDVKCVL